MWEGSSRYCADMEDARDMFDLFIKWLGAAMSRRWFAWLGLISTAAWVLPIFFPSLQQFVDLYLGRQNAGWLIFIGILALMFASFLAWREEHQKNSAPRFTGIEIVNLGPPTSIHTWQAGFKKAEPGGRTWLSDRMLVEEEDIEPPSNIRGKNLRRDYRMLATGETRAGWIAFDVGEGLSIAEQSSLMGTVLLMFRDAFDHLHEISTIPEWARKRKS
jgi:hypothetical protein